MLSRRGLLAAGAAASGALLIGGCSKKLSQVMGFATRMIEIEKRHGGRIGVSALTAASMGNGHGNGTLNINSDQRYAHCSTFKWVLAAAILQQVDASKLTLERKIPFTQKDLLEYAPVTAQHVGEGSMKVGDLCAAALALSDNTAANLLLPLVGGPAGLTAFARSVGDEVTRFDRIEPDLNSNLPNDPRDTTTPSAMAQLLKSVFLGVALTPASLEQLKTWMTRSQTGLKEIRAGVPASWTVADKTGHGANGAVNDVAVVWPKDKAGNTKPPVFLAIYTSGGNLDDDGRHQVIADVTRLVFDTLNFAEGLDTASVSTST